MALNLEKIKRILDGAPQGAIEYSLYDYGDETHPLYLNCENQFYESEFGGGWVDVRLVDNYFHSRHRLSDLRTILAQAEEIERLRHHIALIKHKVEIDARKEVLLSVIGTIPKGQDDE